MKNLFIYLCSIAILAGLSLTFSNCGSQEEEKVNQAPTCTISTPLANATFETGSNVQISVNAVDPDGSVSNVKISINDTEKATLQSSPYNYTWNTSGVLEGDYLIKAVATDEGGLTTMAQVIVTIAGRLAQVTTADITEVTAFSAKGGGEVTDDGGSTVSYRGLVWGKSSGVTHSNKLGHTEDGTGKGSFVSEITGLDPNFTYYVKAYAQNSQGISYGTEKSFKTIAFANVVLGNITDITSNSATVNAEITDDGGTAVTEFGIYWGIDSNPEVTGTRMPIGSGSGEFSVTLTDLIIATTYHVKAFAKNAAGEVLSSTISFTTHYNDILFNPDLIYGTMTDIEGNIYKTIEIGAQIWMAENLRTTKYNNGTDIPLVTENASWAGLSGSAYCWFKNDQTTYGPTYGAMYNWFTVNTGKLCPTGWHVPSDVEWTTLTNHLGGDGDVGGRMKENGSIHWPTNSGGSNSSGFTALPGGFREYSGAFGNNGTSGYWWSSTEYNTSGAWYLYLTYYSSNVGRSYESKLSGFSVRCLRD